MKALDNVKITSIGYFGERKDILKILLKNEHISPALANHLEKNQNALKPGIHAIVRRFDNENKTNKQKDVNVNDIIKDYNTPNYFLY